MDNIKGVEFYRDRIRSKIEEVKDEMGKYRYKLCMAMVDECNSLDDLKEMAELTLQMNMFQYIKTQVYPMLQELGMSLDELRKFDTDTLPEVDKNVVSISSDDIPEMLDDPQNLDAMAMILMQRLQSEPPEETYRDSIIDSIYADNDESESYEEDDDDLNGLLDSLVDDDEADEQDDELPADVDDYFGDDDDAPENVGTGSMSMDEIFDDEDIKSQLEADKLYVNGDIPDNYFDDAQDEEHEVIDNDPFDVSDEAMAEFNGDESDLEDYSDLDGLLESQDEDDDSAYIDDPDLAGFFADDEDTEESQSDDPSESGETDSDGDSSDEDSEDSGEDDEDNGEDYSDLDNFFTDESDDSNEPAEEFDGDSDSDNEDYSDLDNFFVDEDEDNEPDTVEEPDYSDLDGFFADDTNEATSEPEESSDDLIDDPDMAGFFDDDDVGVIDDSNDFLSKPNNVKEPKNARTAKPQSSRASGVKPSTVFSNGTVNGDKTQRMFNRFTSFGNASGKFFNKTAKVVKKVAATGVEKIAPIIDGEADLDF